MKKQLQLIVLFVSVLVSIALADQAYADDGAVRRVRLVVTNSTAFSPSTLIVAAAAVGDVSGAGTDVVNDDATIYCDIHFTQVDIDATHVTLVGRVVEAADPVNFGAFVKITAQSNGTATFIFQTLSGVGSTGPAGIPMKGTVQILPVK
jgi:hypothetical protein